MKHKFAKRWQIKLLIMLLRMRFATKDCWLLKPIDMLLYAIVPALYRRWVDRHNTDTHYFRLLCKKC